MTQDLYKTGRVQARLQTQGLLPSKPHRVSAPLYQTCLHYTVLAKLAPEWNKVGDWYIKGKDFLSHTGHAYAIKMKLSVNKDEIFIALTGTVVRCPPLQVEDLDLSEKEKLDVLKLADSDTQSISLEGFRCHVLPSMKQGWVTSLSLLIPEESPFNSYRDFCRYWKNVYGYRLPRTDEAILYCQVSFFSPGKGKKFTYPNVCLRVHPLHVMGRVDPKPVLKCFLQDLHSRVNTVCGMPLRFAPRIQFPVPSLVNSSQAGEHASLSNKSHKKSAIPYRSSQSVNRLLHGPPNNGQSSCNERTERPIVPLPDRSSESVSCRAENRDNSQLCTVKEADNNARESSSGRAVGNVGEQQSLSKSVHVDKPSPSSGPKGLKISNINKTPSGLPLVGSKDPPSVPQKSNSCEHSFSGSSGPESKTNPTAPRFVPRFKPKQMLQQCSVQKKSGEKVSTLNERKSDKLVPVFKQTIRCPFQVPDTPVISGRIPHHEIETGNASIARESPGAPMKPAFGKPSHVLSHQKKFSGNKSLSASPSVCKNLKRKAPIPGDPPKKARTAPQVQDVDVEKLARMNQLAKVNSASLIAWLKERGVACRTREKKMDLMNKVCHHLHISAPEQ
ncbi:uncharacterized protein LOC101847772 isoform X2 [Aplysia californica]|nr:uncharacterized protein LOC101847772 isoform X2 [Aplysia californica]